LATARTWGGSTVELYAIRGTYYIGAYKVDDEWWIPHAWLLDGAHDNPEKHHSLDLVYGSITWPTDQDLKKE